MYPASMMDFMDMFPTDEACLEYLAAVRWPDGYSCLRCDSTDVTKIRSGYYRCHECRYRGSVIYGTLFQNTRKPLRFWFQAIWYVVSQKNGVSALGLQKALGLGSYHTAWEWLHKLRRAMVRSGRDRLSGLVEMDEIFIGGVRAGKRGRGSDGKAIVLIAVEYTGKRIGRIRLSIIPDASGKSIAKAALQMVEPGSTIRSDGWNAYKTLAEFGYISAPATHATAENGDATPLAHRVASLLKRWWLGTHQGAISPEHLPYYLDEFTFRFNRRTSKSRGKLFYRLIEQALQTAPIQGKMLNTTFSG